jgi:outer membrane protein
MIFVKQRFGMATLVVALITIFGGITVAQELKIGVVNFQVLMERAPHAKGVRTSLQEEFAPLQRIIVAKQKELEELNEKVKRDYEVMGETERRSIEKDLRELQREVTRLQTEFQEDLNLRQNEEISILQRSLLNEVQDYAQTTGYDLVLGDGVLYADVEVNITELVLRAMEANFEAIEVR